MIGDPTLSSYASLQLTESSPPQSFVEPITLSAIKSYLKVPLRSPVDQDEDNELLQMIMAARDQAELLQNRDLVQKQWDQYQDFWPYYGIELRTPLISVDLFTYTDTDNTVKTMKEADDYLIDRHKKPGVVMPPYNAFWPVSMPTRSSSILVRFTSGYAIDHPWWSGAGARVAIGMKLLISHWYNNRLPFETGASAVAEYPYAVSSCLLYGANERAR